MKLTLHRALFHALFCVLVCHRQCPVLSLVLFIGTVCVFIFIFVSTRFSVLNCEVSCPENVCCVGCHPAADDLLHYLWFI